ncbi:MAG: class I SAM-dependent methyltransferase [Acidobacteriota bacterium]
MSEKIEADVVSHYETSDLLERIDAALAAAGVDPAAPNTVDLKPVDEFHTGGLQATEHLLGSLDLDESTRLLDLGCGLGGTARWIAENHAAQVTGIDLTPEYVAVARELTRRVGLQARFEVGSVVDLPFEDGSFDVATMFHVGMNIEDKEVLFHEVARVLRPGGRVALFDVQRLGAGELIYPFPWAGEAGFSFVETPVRYREAAAAAGLELELEQDRVDFTLEFFEHVLARAGTGEAPPVGIHLLMGETASQKIQNFARCVREGSLGPVEMIFTRPGR